MIILVIGDVVDGHQFVGPFDNVEAAIKYAEVWYKNFEWRCVTLESPT